MTQCIANHRVINTSSKSKQSTKENKLYNDPVVIAMVLTGLIVISYGEHSSFVKGLSIPGRSGVVIFGGMMLMTIFLAIYSLTSRYKRLYGSKDLKKDDQ